MKKLVSLVIIVFTLLSLTSCGFLKNSRNPETTKIRIGYMAGPTGMGMAKLIQDNGGTDGLSEKYSFTKYADTNAAKADLAAGNIDVICIPTNEAAAYRNTVDEDAVVLALNCLNSLYLITNSSANVSSLSDFSGQTIYTCKNGTPRAILEYLIRELEIDATVSYEIDGKEILTPQDLSAQVIAGNLPNAVMPEPIVTTSLSQFNSKQSDPASKWGVKIDFTNEWAKVNSTPISMGCIIANGDFARNNKGALDDFLDEYKASVGFISNPENIDSAAEYIANNGIIGKAALAKTALTNLGNSITYIDGNEMKEILVAFYNAMGITLPEESFYYEK
mgnify:CR=1 FL=1